MCYNKRLVVVTSVLLLSMSENYFLFKTIKKCNKQLTNYNNEYETMKIYKDFVIKKIYNEFVVDNKLTGQLNNYKLDVSTYKLIHELGRIYGIYFKPDISNKYYIYDWDWVFGKVEFTFDFELPFNTKNKK